MEAEINYYADDSRRRSSKRIKSSGGKEKALALDRISSLPNPLILHILSFLPTKLAAKTSILSKKWQCLWTSVPILDFHDPSYTPYNMGLKRLNRFVSFVNHTLILHQSHKIEKFRVQMDYKKAFASDVHVWLRFATRKNVEELDLDFSKVYANSDSSSTDDDDDDDDDDDEDDDDEIGYYSRCFLPLNMFSNNPVLVTLKLKNCEIDHYHMDQLGANIYWKSLKVVSLCEMSVHDDFIKDMLSGCPSLELLELLRCWNYVTLDIKNERLGKLVIIEGYLGPDDVSPDNVSPMTILAPYVQSLEISGYLYEFSDINLKSLVDAKLNFHIPSDSSDLGGIHMKYKKILVKLLKKVRHVKDLTVGRWCLQVLSLSEESALPCPPSSLVCLSVDTSLSESELPGITRLLALTPLLETWVINMTSDHVCLDCRHIETEFLKSYDLGGENYWSSQKSSVALALLNLKTVRIIGFEATKSEVELLFFLLKNASMLEKMVIHPQSTTKVSLKKSLEVAQSLLSFPRCSPNAVVLFS